MSKQQGPLDLNELRGTIAVITGAGNNGIGWGLCRHAAGVLGMHVVAVDLHESLTNQAQQRLQAEFPDVQCVGIACDVTDPDALQQCVDTVRQMIPNTPIGAVFANAGVIFNHTILHSTMDEWATTMNVNVLGVVNTIKAFVPLLGEQKTTSVFSTTASIGGLVRGDGGGAAYQASKHAVVSLTESLSFELAKPAPQIRVHVLCPCIVTSALQTSSTVNSQVRDGTIDQREIEPQQLPISDLAMTSDNHARQVFDHIAAGHFYMITDNVRPYVDHDFPFDGLGIVRERMENLMQLTLDNDDALNPRPAMARSAILKGPMFQEMARRTLA